jgi:hypothetical protein
MDAPNHNNKMKRSKFFFFFFEILVEGDAGIIFELEVEKVTTESL